MTRSALAALALGCAALSLSACSDDKPAEETGPKQLTGFTASNARMVLAPVEGNPAAVYFDLAYEGEEAVALRGAEVKGAKSAMLHDMAEWNGEMQMSEMTPLAINKGDNVSFAPGGKHIMVDGPSPELKPGGKTEVTLIFAGGSTYSFPADIRAAGEER